METLTEIIKETIMPSKMETIKGMIMEIETVKTLDQTMVNSMVKM